MQEERKNWSEPELMLAFNLYCKLPFGQYNKGNKNVIQLAHIIGRTPSAVALKLCNFARLDPVHKKRGVKGMSHGSRQEEKIWNEFNHNWERLAYQSEVEIAKLKDTEHQELSKLDKVILEGKEKEATVKVRLTQKFFREMVLASYRTRCAVCSLPEQSLLIGAHIIPWSVNKDLRMNPRNGICLCVLHDKAFDKGLISIKVDYKLIISKTIRKLHNALSIQTALPPYEGIQIRLPDKFLPDKKFIDFHRNNVFIG